MKTGKENLRKRTVQKAIDSFGSWEEREESSVEIVNKIRADKRGYYGRDTNPHPINRPSG